MWLPRFTNDRRIASLAIVALLAGGCAVGPGGSVRDGDIEVPAKALTLYEQAVSSMAAGEMTDAELRFKEFLLSYPDFPGAHINLAIIYSGRDDDAAAETSLDEALRIDPAHAVALNQLGMLRRRQGRFLEAESAYLKAVTAAPDYALAHYNLGVLNDLYLQRLDAALEHYERYQELAGEDEQVGKWIVDLKRRIDAAQRTANVTE
ncbi:MAG: tetratricopeptide repeat protein [Woeseiaceae bacterium]|nr:tetratricopeptide repeat protein [Woeseiaceae bacterium]